ncbi:hypothetical protein [Alkaliphilus sp. B6464]|uniref:hypothetical protein n=1 Tax=Alkaliphilus sp. B6464 TaxID=2731219 RepID=UPI001BAAAB74|nr:hypothetical protein [Alkaliphilus sp. B6464]QUH19967.1 hypothetical protein HYG84_08680 [Alkaliphilus sp. B6464]
MNKKIIITIALSLITILSGCSIGTTTNDKEYTSQDLQRLSCIEVYSAEDNVLINTIEDSEVLFQFNELDSEVSGFAGKGKEIEKMLEDSIPMYKIVIYKTPAATYNDGKLEKIVTITTYKDINMIKTEVSAETIKSFSVPSKYLTFYEDITDEKMEFLVSLASF